MCVDKTWDQFNKTFTSVIYMFVQYVTIMFSDAKTMVKLVIYTCERYIKLTLGLHQTWEPNPLPLML